MIGSGILRVEPELGQERSCLLGIAECSEARAEVAYRPAHVGMVDAEDASVSGEGVSSSNSRAC
jgi:hypothetical protein